MSEDTATRDEPAPFKNIVLCSDGTGNRGGRLRGTNVWQVFRSLEPEFEDQSSGKIVRQFAFHQDGVGTQSFTPFKVLGGAFGWGYSRNIRDLYAFLVSCYNPGDRIYLFGFSRGAYTVRALGGMILHCGILDRHEFDSSDDLRKAVWTMFRAYRDKYSGKYWPIAGVIRRELTKGGEEKRAKFEKDGKIHKDCTIRFIGVWDTVDAVGMPMDWLAALLDLVVKVRFTDQTLSESVLTACHAVSIDDERKSFWPVMWDESNNDAERIEQVWFSGVHSNVGGGYPKDEMALVSLDWMMEKAAACGLGFRADERTRIREQANVHGKLYNSRAGPAAYYRYRPRDIGKICAGYHEWFRIFSKPEFKIETPKIHISAIERIARATDKYAPAGIPGQVEIVETQPGGSLFTGAARASFPNTGADRTAALEVAKSCIAKRRGLYWVFVAYTAALAALAAFFRWCPLAAKPADFADAPWPAKWVAKGIDTLIPPGFVSDLARPLLDQAAKHWEFGLLGLAVLVLLGVLKYRWERETTMRALDAWRRFRDAVEGRSEPAPPTSE
jgi:uncharacterized protein (DUF2235 family)